MARRTATTDPAAQLVQLGQAQAFGVLDNHQAGVGHVDPDFDDRGRHQQLQLALLEFGHDRRLFSRLHAPVDQADAQFAQGTAELLEGGFGGLAGQFLGLFDQGADPVGLAPLGASGAYPLDHLEASAVGYQDGVYRRTTRGQLVEDRRVQVGIGAHGQGARNRGGGHDQLMWA
ncbi:hypothetical protein D3C77_324960 [compost metagenome]